MTNEAAVRTTHLVVERGPSDEVHAEEHRRADELAGVKAEAWLGYLAGILGRLVSTFNRSAVPDQRVTLKIDDRRIDLQQAYTTLLILSFEAGAVSIATPPPRQTRKRFRFAPTPDGSTMLVDESRPEAIPGSAESFCEGVLTLALRLHA